MTSLRLRFAFLFLLFVLGTTPALAEKHYQCPMHSEVHSHEPGQCPICKMDLVEVEDKEAPKAPKQEDVKADIVKVEKGAKEKIPSGVELKKERVERAPAPKVVSTLKLKSGMVQNMAMRTSTVKKQSISRHIRTLGTVDVAEDQIAVVNLRFSGWVEKLYVDKTGDKVEPGQALAAIHSPELVSAQEDYLLAFKSQGEASALAESSARRLRYFGMSAGEIAKIRERGASLRTVTIRSPSAGYVLQKNVVLGAKVSEGQDIFRIGNLQNIWINAEVYESDAPWIHLGAPATMELSFQEGKMYSGKVSYIYPTLNPKTHTLGVRLEFENPGLSLKPGMFATVRIESRRKEGALALPTSSIIHSGERQIVFVSLGSGRFEKRQVITGLVADGHFTEIKDGVIAGEKVVVSGQFLLDSESQLQEAVQKISPDHEPGDTYYTCSMHPDVVEDKPGSCPICGMDLVEREH